MIEKGVKEISPLVTPDLEAVRGPRKATVTEESVKHAAPLAAGRENPRRKSRGFRQKKRAESKGRKRKANPGGEKMEDA